MIYTLLFFILGFVISVFCTPWVIRLAHRGIGLDYAHESRKKQEVPIPRLGGMPLMLPQDGRGAFARATACRRRGQASAIARIGASPARAL